MKHAKFPLFALALAALVLPSCKAPPTPEFGIPDDPKPGLRGKLFDGERKSYSQLRREWKMKEREKAKAMFDRMRDEY